MTIATMTQQAKTPKDEDGAGEVSRAPGEGAVSKPSGAGLAVVSVLVSGPIAVVGFATALLLGTGVLSALGIALLAQGTLVLSALLLGALFAEERERPALGEGDRPVRRPSGNGVQESDADDAKVIARWNVFPARGTGSNARIGLLGSRDRAALAQRIARAGYEVHLSDSAEALLGAIAAAPAQWSALIVDLDTAADPGGTISDALTDMRLETPGVPMIALGASPDAPGPWDAAVHAPTTWVTLRRVIEAARQL